MESAPPNADQLFCVLSMDTESYVYLGASLLRISIISSPPYYLINNPYSDFPGHTVDRNLPANAGDTGSIPSLGKFHIC